MTEAERLLLLVVLLDATLLPYARMSAWQRAAIERLIRELGLVDNDPGNPLHEQIEQRFETLLARPT